jgi:hypothetical protein
VAQVVKTFNAINVCVPDHQQFKPFFKFGNCLKLKAKYKQQQQLPTIISSLVQEQLCVAQERINS